MESGFIAKLCQVKTPVFQKDPCQIKKTNSGYLPGKYLPETLKILAQDSRD
jgi:hypothetical protein